MSIQSVLSVSLKADEDVGLELKQMLEFFSPLFAILRKDHQVTSLGSRNSGGGSNGYGQSCCDENNDYLGLISFISLGLLGLFLVTLLSTSSSGRRKRSDGYHSSENTSRSEQFSCLIFGKQGKNSRNFSLFRHLTISIS